MLRETAIPILSDARSWCVLTMFVVWAVLVLFVLLRTACKALGRLTRATAFVFCGFALVWSLCANKANTNAPPDDVSGPVPELTGDSEPGSEGDDFGDDLPDDATSLLFSLAPLHLVGDTENRPGAIVLPIPMPVEFPPPALQNSPVYSADLWVSNFTHTVSQSVARVVYTNATQAFAGVPERRRRVVALHATRLEDGGDWSYLTNVPPFVSYYESSYADFVFRSNLLPAASVTNAFFAFGANVDSDLDGVCDLEEMFRYHTNPYSADTDGDGFTDDYELSPAMNPLDPSDGLLVKGRHPDWYVANYPGILCAVTNAANEVIVDFADLSQTNLYYNLYLSLDSWPYGAVDQILVENGNGCAPDGAVFELTANTTNVIPLRIGQSYRFSGIFPEHVKCEGDDPFVVVSYDRNDGGSFTVCRPVRILLTDVPPPADAQRCGCGHVHARYCHFETDPSLTGDLAVYDTDCVTVDNVNRRLEIKRSRMSSHHGASYYLDHYGALGTFSESDGPVDLVFDNLSPYSLGGNVSCFCGSTSYCPDCIGSTAAWYNLMFPDLLTATNASDGSVSLSWRDGVASNAYYFVDLTTTNKSIRVTVTPRVPTAQGAYQVQFLAGMTARIPLLAGVAYDLVGNADGLSVAPLDADVVFASVSNCAYVVERSLSYELANSLQADAVCSSGHVHARHYRITTSIPDIPGALEFDDTKCFTPFGPNEFVVECDGFRAATCPTNGVITGRFIYEGVTNSFAITNSTLCRCDNLHHPSCPCGTDSLCCGCDTTIYGQDEYWVRANIDRLRELDPAVTGVDEILSVGYAGWVDQQVGEGLLNGLYLFKAEFLAAPQAPVGLYVGDHFVSVTNAGEYVFLLKKGTEYALRTIPFDDDVVYQAQDDVGPEIPLFASLWNDAGLTGEWSSDAGEFHFYRPYSLAGSYFDGKFSWVPSFKGTPDLLPGQTISFPMSFSVEFDYPEPEHLVYYWESSDSNVRFSSPHSQSTMVLCDCLPRWGELELSVSTLVDGLEFRSSFRSLYGESELGSPGLKCCCSEYFDTYRPGDAPQPVTFCFNSPCPTSGVIRALASSDSDVRLYYDRECTDEVQGVFQSWLVDASSWSCTLYARCGFPSQSIGDGRFVCYFSDGGPFSEENIVESRFTVVERTSEPILSREVADSDPIKYYNPCLAAPNSWVHLCVSVLPRSIPDADIVWRCVSGDATFVSPPNGREVVVRIGHESSVFEISMPDILPSARVMRIAVYIRE